MTFIIANKDRVKMHFCPNNSGPVWKCHEKTENPCVGGSIPPPATTSIPPNKIKGIVHFRSLNIV